MPIIQQIYFPFVLGAFSSSCLYAMRFKYPDGGGVFYLSGNVHIERNRKKEKERKK
jgi:hypothetical protein